MVAERNSQQQQQQQQQQALRRDLQKRSWWLFSLISLSLIEYSSREEAEEDPVDLGEEEVSQSQSSSIESRRKDYSCCVCKRCTVMPSEVEHVYRKELPFFLQLSGFINRL